MEGSNSDTGKATSRPGDTAALPTLQQDHQQQQQQQPGASSAVGAGSIFVPDDAPVYDMPVSAINRPLLSELDPHKVAQFAADMQAGAEFTPIEVAHVQDNGQNYYFAFGGCHRWAAVKQLGLPTIRARLIQVSPATINTYLGASSPFRQQQQQQQQQQRQQQQHQQQQQPHSSSDAAGLEPAAER